MKTISMFLAATAMAGIATAATANVVGTPATGTINITGTVTPKCSNSGTSVQLNVGELADGNGQVVTAFAQNTQALLTVKCTSSAPTVSLTASPMAVIPAVTSVPDGYTNLVQYTATVTAYLTGGAANAVKPYAKSDGSTPAGASSTLLTGPLANANNNIQVDISAPASNGSQLMAGNYQGTVVVTVSPGS